MAALSSLFALAREGSGLRQLSDPTSAHISFIRWVRNVGQWLDELAPESGLSVEWLTIGESNLVRGGQCYDSPTAWQEFDFIVGKRLVWLSNVRDRLPTGRATAPERIQSEAVAVGRREVQLDVRSRAIVDPDRIEELKALGPGSLDFTKLIRLCEELNVAFAAECYMTTAMVTRAIVDHVPPIFSCKTFAEVANNYAGSKSFKDSMKTLETSSRKIADQHLHCQIRTSEVLPSPKQVDFSQDLDVLLAEIVRLHKRPSGEAENQ